MQNKLHLLFIIVGVISLVATAYFGINRYKFLQTAESVIGKYTEVDRLVSDYKPGAASYQPRVTYQDKNGQTYSIRSNVGSSNKKAWGDLIGKEVGVYYNSEKPSQGVINGVWNLWGATITFLVISLGMLITGFVIHKY